MVYSSSASTEAIFGHSMGVAGALRLTHEHLMRAKEVLTSRMARFLS
jgi:hypothetical protein